MTLCDPYMAQLQRTEKYVGAFCEVIKHSANLRHTRFVLYISICYAVVLNHV